MYCLWVLGSDKGKLQSDSTAADDEQVCGQFVRLQQGLTGIYVLALLESVDGSLGSAADPEDWLGRMRARLAGRVPSNNDNNTAAAVWVDMA